jgi:hypothetical protein
LDCIGNSIDEFVVYTKVREFAGERAANGAQSQPEPGHKEEKSDKHSPKGASKGSRADKRMSLTDFGFSIQLTRHNRGIFKLQELHFLHLVDAVNHFSRAGHRVESKNHQVAH